MGLAQFLFSRKYVTEKSIGKVSQMPAFYRNSFSVSDFYFTSTSVDIILFYGLEQERS